MLELIYGHTVTSPDDKYLQIAEGALKGSNDVAGAGIDIIELVPSRRFHLWSILGGTNNSPLDTVRHLPYWIWGRGVKQLIDTTKRMVEAVHTEPYKLVEDAIVSLALRCGSSPWSHCLTTGLG